MEEGKEAFERRRVVSLPSLQKSVVDAIYFHRKGKIQLGLTERSQLSLFSLENRKCKLSEMPQQKTQSGLRDLSTENITAALLPCAPITSMGRRRSVDRRTEQSHSESRQKWERAARPSVALCPCRFGGARSPAAGNKEAWKHPIIYQPKEAENILPS